MSKGPDICCLASFINFTGIWPVDVSEQSLSISFSTSIVETQPRLKECVVRGHSEKEFTRSIRSDLLSGLVASVLSFVLKKNVLSLSGSSWRGLGLGWRMRCTTLHTSFGRLDRWESVNNKYPFRLINHRLILLRTALKATQESSSLFSLWASWRNLSRTACSLRISSEFIHGEGGRVTLIPLRGACLSMHFDITYAVINVNIIW